MKTCPVCGAKAFDDMDVCYGCLHRFDEKRSVASPNSVEPDSRDGGKGVGGSEKGLSDAGEEKTSFARETEGESHDVKCEGAGPDSGGEKMFVINVPLPQGVKGVRVAVDFDISGDPCA